MVCVGLWGMAGLMAHGFAAANLWVRPLGISSHSVAQRIYMCIYMCIEMHTHMCGHVHNDVYRHVWEHVLLHVYRHAQQQHRARWRPLPAGSRAFEDGRACRTCLDGRCFRRACVCICMCACAHTNTCMHRRMQAHICNCVHGTGGLADHQRWLSYGLYSYGLYSYG